MQDYNVVFLGYPNWWATCPMAVFTFLEEYDFPEKTVIPLVPMVQAELEEVSEILQIQSPMLLF